MSIPGASRASIVRPVAPLAACRGRPVVRQCERRQRSELVGPPVGVGIEHAGCDGVALALHERAIGDGGDGQTVVGSGAQRGVRRVHVLHEQVRRRAVEHGVVHAHDERVIVRREADEPALEQWTTLDVLPAAHEVDEVRIDCSITRRGRGRCVDDLPRDGPGRVDLLHRAMGDRDEAGAERFVAGDRGLDRRSQASDVERPDDAAAEELEVGLAATLELLLQPRCAPPRGSAVRARTRPSHAASPWPAPR